MKRYTDPDFRATFEETVPGEVDRINSIVSRLLEFAKPRPVTFRAQPIERVINEVLALVENQTRKAKVQVFKHYPEREALVYGDEQQLHQVILNLVLNALQAMKVEDEHAAGANDGWNGDLDISVEFAHARLRSEGLRAVRETECVRIHIMDTGCGIPPENMDELFTPFFTTKEEGSGLGLSVVHGIVNEHGGDIDVRSRLGEGTTFTVTLPAATAVEAMLPAESRPAEV
jgi:signal transduction histidine kinase